MTLQVDVRTGLYDRRDRYDSLVYNKLKVVRDIILESWWCLLLFTLTSKLRDDHYIAKVC